MKTPTLLALTLAATTVFAANVRAETSDETETREFVTKASISNQFEILSSRLALQKSTDPHVKEFARQMVTDHEKAASDMQAALKASNVERSVATNQLDEKHQKIMDDLKSASAEDFDDKYIDAQETAHDEAVSLFNDYAEDGKDRALKEFAAKTLPTLRKHNEHVEKMD